MDDALREMWETLSELRTLTQTAFKLQVMKFTQGGVRVVGRADSNEEVASAHAIVDFTPKPKMCIAFRKTHRYTGQDTRDAVFGPWVTSVKENPLKGMEGTIQDFFENDRLLYIQKESFAKNPRDTKSARTTTSRERAFELEPSAYAVSFKEQSLNYFDVCLQFYDAQAKLLREFSDYTSKVTEKIHFMYTKAAREVMTSRPTVSSPRTEERARRRGNTTSVVSPRAFQR